MSHCNRHSTNITIIRLNLVHYQQPCHSSVRLGFLWCVLGIFDWLPVEHPWSPPGDRIPRIVRSGKDNNGYPNVCPATDRCRCVIGVLAGILVLQTRFASAKHHWRTKMQWCIPVHNHQMPDARLIIGRYLPDTDSHWTLQSTDDLRFHVHRRATARLLRD